MQRWVLHSGAHPGGGARRRALVAVALFHDAHQEACHAIFGAHAVNNNNTHNHHDQQAAAAAAAAEALRLQKRTTSSGVVGADTTAFADITLDYDPDNNNNNENKNINGDNNDGEPAMDDPARTAAERVRAESEGEQSSAKSYLRAARTNEPELAAAVKSEETARRLLAVAERSAPAPSSASSSLRKQWHGYSGVLGGAGRVGESISPLTVGESQA